MENVSIYLNDKKYIRTRWLIINNVVSLQTGGRGQHCVAGGEGVCTSVVGPGGAHVSTISAMARQKLRRHVHQGTDAGKQFRCDFIGYFY